MADIHQEHSRNSLSAVPDTPLWDESRHVIRVIASFEECLTAVIDGYTQIRKELNEMVQEETIRNSPEEYQLMTQMKELLLQYDEQIVSLVEEATKDIADLQVCEGPVKEGLCEELIQQYTSYYDAFCFPGSYT